MINTNNTEAGDYRLIANKNKQALLEILKILRRDNKRSRSAIEKVFGSDEATKITTKQAIALNDILKKLHPSDICNILESLTISDRLTVWQLTSRNLTGSVLQGMETDVKNFLLENTDENKLVEALSLMSADDVSGILKELPQELAEKIKTHLPKKLNTAIGVHEQFNKEQVGSHMRLDTKAISADLTAGTLLRAIRHSSISDTTDSLIVVDRSKRPLGVLKLTSLLTCNPNTKINSLLNHQWLVLSAVDNIRTAINAFERYKVNEAAVIDRDGILIGKLLSSDIMSFLQNEEKEDNYEAVGLSSNYDVFSNAWNAAKVRWVWLCFNLSAAFISTFVISMFEDTIAKFVILASLMPIVVAIAGNTGNQTLVLLLQANASGKISKANFLDICYREMGVAFINGTLWGSVAGLITYLIYSDFSQTLKLSLIMQLGILLNILLGTIVALFAPLMLRKLGFNPSLGSPILLTFTTDSGGFLIFLALAYVFL